MSKGNPKIGGSGFISFSSLTTNGNSNNNNDNNNNNSATTKNTSVSQVLGIISPMYTGNDSDLSVACKKVLKKDSITKLKAIGEILMVINNESQRYINIVDDVLNDFLPFFMYMYMRLVFDNDRKIREKINYVLHNIIKIDKRILGPYMKILIGPWCLSIADPFTEVSKLSLDSFYLAILPKKRQSVLSYLSSSLFEYIFKNLEHTVETLSDLSQCTREEAEERFERVTVSSLECIKIYIELLNDEENLKLIQADSTPTTDEIFKGYKSIINEKMWKKSMHKNDSIRKATYKLLSVTFTKLSSIYETKLNWQRLANIIINIFDEINPNNLVEMYDLILMSFSHHIVALEIWKYIDTSIDIIPKLSKKMTDYRNVTLQYITSLIGLLPVDEVSIWSINIHKPKITNAKRIENESSTTVLAIINVLDNLYTNRSIDQLDLFLLERQCIIEVSTLILLRKCVTIVDKNNSEYNVIEIVTKIMQHYILNSINDILCTVYNVTVSLSVLDSIKQCLVQLYRGTLKERNFNFTQWKSLFWDLFLNHSLFHINNFMIPKDSATDSISGKVSNYLIIVEFMYSIQSAIHNEDNKENIGVTSIASEITAKYASKLTDTISQKLIIYDNDYNIQAVDLIELITIIKSLMIFGKLRNVSLFQLQSGDWIFCISKWLFMNVDTNEDVSLSSTFIFGFIIDQIKSIFLHYIPIINENVVNILLHKIVYGKSVVCLNLFSRCYSAISDINQLHLGTDGVTIFVNTCKSFILNNSNNESNCLVSSHINDKILFTIQFILQYHYSSIIDEVIALLMDQNSFLSHCVILSLYFIHLNRGVGLNIVNEGIIIPSCIIKDEIYIRKMMISVMLTNKTKPSFHDSNELIYSWNDLKVKLIPLIDASAIYSFISDAIDQLTILFNDDSNHQNSFTLEWCQNIIELIHVDNSTDQLNKLPIYNYNYWKSRNKCNLLCVNFQSVDELYRKAYNKSIFSILPISTYIYLYWEILDLNFENQDFICNNLVLNIFNYLSDLAFEGKVVMLNTLVMTYETIYTAKNSTLNTNKIFMSLIESLISTDKFKLPITNNNFGVHKLVLDPILSTDIIGKGQELYYINFTVDEVETAELLETHRETGVEPYYTIRLLVSNKEIQTERYKLLLIRPACFQLDNVRDKELSACDLLCQWITTVLFPLFNNIRNNNIDEILIDILCQLYRIISNACYDSLSIRDMCFMYKELLLDIFGKLKPNMINLNYGLKLLSEVLSNNMNFNGVLYKTIIGNGVWLLPIFQSLKSISANIMSTKSTDDNDLMLMVSILNVIHMFVAKFQMRECHQHLLSCIEYIVFIEERCNRSLQDLIQNCIFTCCKVYWNERNLLLHETNAELKSNPFLRNYHGTEFSNIEVSALSIIVNCFINDEVKDSYKNNAALAILSCFYSKDIYLSNGILNKISLNKDYVHIESTLTSIISNTVKYHRIVLAATKLLDIVTSLAVSPFFVEIVNNCNSFINSEVEKDELNGDLIDSLQDDVDKIEIESNKMLLNIIVGSDVLITEILKNVDIINTNSDQDSNNKSVVSLLLLWILLLQKIDTCSTVSGLSSIRARCGLYLHHHGLLQKVLRIILKHSSDFLQFKSLLKSFSALFTAFNCDTCYFDDKSTQCIINYSLYRTICTFPAMVRTWWSNDCNRLEKQRISKFIETTVRKPLLNRELLIIENAFLHKLWDPSVFTIKGSNISGELCASLVIEDGPKVELNIKVPTTYPLNNVEVEITKIGIAENRVRRWILQIIQLLSMQDGTVLDALLMWKKNVEKELDGIEPCPICYSILHPKSMSLPKLKCPTCSNKFHNQCLYTWFKSSGKSKCVICQQPMYN